MLALLLLALACAVVDSLRHTRPHPAAGLARASHIPNLFNVPELGAVGYQPHPHSPRRAEAVGALLDEHHSDAVEVETAEHGVTSFRYNTHVRNTTVRLEDYMDVLDGSTFACARDSAASGGEDARAPFTLTITLPSAASLPTRHARRGREHLLARLTHSKRHLHTNLSAAVVFGTRLLASHPSFALSDAGVCVWGGGWLRM